MSASQQASGAKGAVHGAAGFTLLELAVVLSVLGILVAIAVPSFGYLAATTRVKAASSDLHLALLKARAEAVKRDAPATIAANGADWSGGWQITTGGTQLLTQGALKGVTVEETGDNLSFTYQSSGRIQGGATPQFEIAPDKPDAVSVDLRRCIVVQPNGTASVKQGGC